MRSHYIGSTVEESRNDGAHTVSDETKEAWEVGKHFLCPHHVRTGPNRAPTVVAPSTPVPPDEETPSIPETPKFNPAYGGSGPPLEEPVVGIATRTKPRMGSRTPLL